MLGFCAVSTIIRGRYRGRPDGEFWNLAIQGTGGGGTVAVFARWRYPRDFAGERGSRLAMRLKRRGPLTAAALWAFAQAALLAVRDARYILRRDRMLYP